MARDMERQEQETSGNDMHETRAKEHETGGKDVL
jgi:hypothetical protein